MAKFKYMGRPLDQTDNDLPAFWINIMRKSLVWGGLGELLRREGSDPKVAAMFYRAVIQAVLLFGDNIWVI